jgi:O-antigen chain-terminating methyltransferase
METVQGDVRALPFPSASFELVICVSTLEHVGRDNRVYGLADERSESGIVEALVELGRVLVPGGRILITVPCGEVEDHGWFVQLREEDWRKVFAEAGLVVREDETYVLSEQGWSLTRSLPPTGIKYGARGPGASAVFCAELTR